MELEEAIKNVEKFNKETRFRDCGILNNSIETVLEALEKLKQDNYKLDRENQLLFENQINSIPKKKIEDKIKSIEKSSKEALRLGEIDLFEKLDCQRMILQALLEDK